MWTSKLIFLFLLIRPYLNNDLLNKFHQNDYKLKDFRADFVSYNPSIVKYVKVTSFKFNRTTAAHNLSICFLIDVKDEIEMVVQSHKFVSNEYRHFPIRFQINWFKAFNSDIIGLRETTKCGNIQTPYFLKNVDYYYCNFVPDERKFPPFIPNGLYMSTVVYSYRNREAFTVNFLAEVYRPIAIPTN